MSVATPTHPKAAVVPLWLKCWAVLTVCAAFGLLFLGSLVTTTKAGMADPIWPTYPWHLWLVSWEEPRPGFLIEHGHRLAGYVVGCGAIVLAAGLWLCGAGRGLRWLGIAGLAGVSVQGLLGGFRVVLDQWLGPNLALVHGSFAPVVFALLAGAAWLAVRRANHGDAPTVRAAETRLERWSLVVTGLVFLQIIFGALVRHTYSSLGQRGHWLLAFAVTAAVAVLVKEVRDFQSGAKTLKVLTTILALLVVLQLLMGVEAWMLRFSAAGIPQQIAVRTIHVLLGSLILATATVTALEVHWRRGEAAVGRNGEGERGHDAARGQGGEVNKSPCYPVAASSRLSGEGAA